MATTTQLILETVVKGTETARAQMKGLMTSVGQLSDKLIATGKGLTAGLTIPIVGLGLNMVKLSADAEESKNKFDAVFGEMRDTTHNVFEQMGADVGRSTIKLEQYGSGIGSLVQGMGATKQQAAALSPVLTQLALDQASFNNVSDADAINAFTSALSGEAEPLRRLGINVNQAALEQEALALGINKSAQELTGYERGMVVASLATKAMTRSGALGDAAKTSDSFANSLKHLQDNIYDLQVGFGDIIKEALRPILGHLVAFTEGLKSMDAPTKNMIVQVALAAAAVGPLLLVVGSLAKSITAIASPIGLITTALTALAAAFTYTYATNEDFRNSVNQTVSELIKFGTEAFETIKEVIVTTVDTISKVWAKIGPPVMTAINYIKDVIVKGVTWIAGEIKDWIIIITNIFSQLWKLIGPFVMFFVKMFQDNFQTIVDFVVNVGNIIFQPIRIAFDIIYGVAKAFFQLLGGDTKGAWNTIKTYTADAWEGIKSFFGNIIGAIGNIFKGMWGFLSSGFTQIWNSIGQSVTDGMNYILTGIGNIGTSITTYFTDLGSKALEWGSNMINQFIDGILSAPGKLVDAVSGVASTVSDYLGFGSPTKLGPGAKSDQWIPNAINMWNTDLKKGKGVIGATLSTITDLMGLRFDGAAQSVGKSAKAASSAIAAIPAEALKVAGPIFDDLNEKYDDFFTRAQAFPEKLKKPFEGMYNAFRDTKDKITESLNSLGQDFEKNLDDIDKSVTDTQDKLNKLATSYYENDQSEGKDLATHIVDQQNLVADLQKKLVDKQTEITNETADDKKTALQAELDEIQKTLDLESSALRRARDLTKEYDDEIREVKKRNRQSDFTNFIDDWNAKRAKELEEQLIEQKKLQDEIRSYNRQRDQIVSVYEQSYSEINNLQDIATQVYKSAINEQVLATEAGTNLMKQYFDRVADSASKVATRVNGIKNIKIVSDDNFGGARASGGPVEQGKSYVVGENGQEIFRPTTSGEIIPNSALGGSTTKTLILNLNVDKVYGNKDFVREMGKVIVQELSRNVSF